MNFPSRTLLWLKEGWEAEFVSDLGPSYVLHVHATKKAAGALVHRVVRIIDRSHILWMVERDLKTPGDYKGKGLAPKKDSRGRVIRRMEEWVQPFHEGVKRLAPRNGGHPSVRFYWLTSFLRWRYLPCICGHHDIIEHLAAEAGTTRKVVEMSVERAAREAARTIGDKVPGNPVALSVQSAHPSGQRPSRQRSLRALPSHGGAKVAG